MIIRTFLGLLFLTAAALPLATGCSSSSTSGGPGGHGPGSGPESRTAPVESSSHDVPECDIGFCPPASRHLVLTNALGTPGLEANCNDAYCALSYAQGDAFIYLSFDASLAQEGMSDSSVHDRFDYLWAQVDFPDAPTDHSAFEYQTDAKRGLGDAFESLSFENGRLKATIHDQTTRVAQHVVSDEDGCLNGDVGGECFCGYSGFTIPVVVDLDLSVGSLDGGN